MALLIRKIKKNRWYKAEVPLGAAEPPVPAEPVGDFSTFENVISVWHIEPDRTNLDRVITALSGANTDYVSQVDYAIFDAQIISDLALEMRNTAGESPDEEANTKWHRDIVVGTAENLCKLVQRVYRECDKERVSEAAIRRRLKAAIESGQILSSRLRAAFKEDLAK